MNKKLFAASAISLSIPLGGCAGLGFFDFGGSSDQAQVATAKSDFSAYFDRRLADGKRHLAAGRLGHASEAFRQASYEPRHEAEAFNGLGIVYDRLGRTDLAERYFKAAVAAAPLEFRFARNLARFEGKEMRAVLAANAEAKPEEKAADVVRADAVKSVAGGDDAIVTVAQAPVQLDAVEPARVVTTELKKPSPVKLVAARTPKSEPKSLFEEAFPSPDMVFDKKEKPIQLAAQGSATIEAKSSRSDERLAESQIVSSKARSTGSNTIETGSAPPVNQEVRAMAKKVRIVRISPNEVRLTRSGTASNRNAVHITRNTHSGRAPVVHIGKSSDGTVMVSSLGSADTPQSTGSLAELGSDASTMTPLGLGDAWSKCKSGC